MALIERYEHAKALEDMHLQHEAFTEYMACIFLCMQTISLSKGTLKFGTTESLFSSTVAEGAHAFFYARECIDHLQANFNTEVTTLKETKFGVGIDEPFVTTKKSHIEHNELKLQLQAPIEDAQQKNQALLHRYQIRVKKLEAMPENTQNNVSLQTQLSDLALAFNREFAENLQMAREKQQSILEQRQARRQLFATLQNKAIEHEYNKKSAFKGLSKLRNDKAQQVCQDMDSEWRKLLTVEGVSDKTVLQYLGNILSIKSHPLGRECMRLVDEIEGQLSGSSTPTDLIITNVHSLLQTIVDMILATYPELSSFNDFPNTTGDFVSADLVLLCVEMVTFPRIYPSLFELFKVKHIESDNLLDRKYQIFAAVSPAHMGVGKKFWLLEDKEYQLGNAPYQRAIDYLRRLSSIPSISSKLHCLVEASKAAVDCTTQFWQGKVAPEELVIGADDLVPILSFVVVRAAVPHMHAELALIEEFIGERQMIGETGYCLSTYQTCLFYINSLDWEEIDNQFQQQLQK